MAWYCDSSALLKLLVSEDETPAIQSAVLGRVLITSELSLTEVGRALLRHGQAGEEKLEELIDRVDFVPVTSDLLAEARKLLPPSLRTLDAIQLATALDLGDACDGMLTYDFRLQTAARSSGLTVESPGQSAAP